MKIDNFRQELTSRQNDIIETALKDLKKLFSGAIEELGKLLRKSKIEGIKLRAIALIIDHTIKMKEFEDIEKRLEAIERRLNE